MKLLTTLIGIYQKIFSPRSVLRSYYFFQCHFTPSCSEYASASLKKFPLWKALPKSLWRILRCHPWSRGGVDLP